ncbi:MAG: hypothetical protein FWB96_01450 [Defluviitaleaceae bacterium]|nr:hypothetical protein [Defluviitaleaceae bacterium]MCL2261641.1 hypothetical protein [Defluviitaleaceae bacterium]
MKTKLKQGTLSWEKARDTRIGSSEIFDIVRYYATDDELQNCGINAEAFREESPFTTAWALYHKMKQDGLFQREELPPELSDYGHAVEPYGATVLKNGRTQSLKRGEVFAEERLIASLDVSGISEECDMRPFDYGGGDVVPGMRFVCEQKSIMPARLKKGLPLKYIIQAQYQVMMSGADFFILQVMVLENDTTYERGLVAGMSVAKRKKHLAQNMKISHLYFNNNTHLEMLIRLCLDRFFSDVDNSNEPTPFLANDKQRNIIASIRANTFFNADKVLEIDLIAYLSAKERCDASDNKKAEIMQDIIELAMQNNACRFRDGKLTAQFDKAGRFLVKHND